MLVKLDQPVSSSGQPVQVTTFIDYADTNKSLSSTRYQRCSEQNFFGDDCDLLAEELRQLLEITFLDRGACTQAFPDYYSEFTVNGGVPLDGAEIGRDGMICIAPGAADCLRWWDCRPVSLAVAAPTAVPRCIPRSVTLGIGFGTELFVKCPTRSIATKTQRTNQVRLLPHQ